MVPFCDFSLLSSLGTGGEKMDFQKEIRPRILIGLCNPTEGVTGNENIHNSGLSV